VECRQAYSLGLQNCLQSKTLNIHRSTQLSCLFTLGQLPHSAWTLLPVWHPDRAAEQLSPRSMALTVISHSLEKCVRESLATSSRKVPLHETGRRSLSRSASLFASLHSASAGGSSREESLFPQAGAALGFHRRVLRRPGHPANWRSQAQRRQPGSSQSPPSPFRRHDFPSSPFALSHREIPGVASREELHAYRNLQPVWI